MLHVRRDSFRQHLTLALLQPVTLKVRLYYELTRSDDSDIHFPVTVFFAHLVCLMAVLAGEQRGIAYRQ